MSNNTNNNTDNIPNRVQTVIIGGGIMGCGLAYHLAKEGATDTILFEKGELTSGSTWHAAGQITHAVSNYALLQCIKYNLDLYGQLEAETGQSITMHNCGSLRMVYSKEELDWQKHILSLIKNFNLPGELVSVERVKELHPFYNTDGLIAALHTPDDGHCDPAGLAFALAKGARQQGIKIQTRCRVLSVKPAADGWMVTTEKGTVECEHLVNAGGTYARQMALEVGYDLPTTSMTHHYFVTEKIPAFAELEKELPVVRDDSRVSGYLRMEQKAGLIGVYEKTDTNHVWEDGTPWESEHELFDPDYERVFPWLEKALERFPILNSVGIKREVHGAISHPPDGNPLIGPAPHLKNYWLCCGTQIAIGWGPGLTRELAKWMVHGAADINMNHFDPRRFGKYADKKYQVTKGHEDYSLRHEIPYPHFSRLAMRPIRKSPLYDLQQAKGAVFEEIHGWERPRWFAPDGIPAKDIYSFRREPTLHNIVADESKAVREAAGVIDFSAFTKVMLEGNDAAAFLDKIMPCKLPAVGRVVLSHLLTRNGRVDMEVSISRLGDNQFYLICGAIYEERLEDRLNELRQNNQDITITNLTAQWATLALSGPKSREILSPLTTTPLDNDNFAWLRAKTISIGEHEVLALRLSYAGELGWELHGEYNAIRHAYQELFRIGAPLGLRDYGTFAMNSLRMEKGYVAGSELTNEVTLPEAQVLHHVDKNKADFFAKDAYQKSLDNIRWLCVYLQIEDDGANDGNGGEAVFYNGERVGAITSINYGHTVGKLLAFAYVNKTALAAAGTALTVRIMDEDRHATVITQAAYDAKSQRPRG